MGVDDDPVPLRLRPLGHASASSTSSTACSDEVWSRSDVVGERGLGGILVHQLGAPHRDGATRSRRQAPAATARARAAALDRRSFGSSWAEEWVAVDAWIAELDHAGPARSREEGVAVWQMLAPRRQPRHPAPVRGGSDPDGSAISPGEIDMIFYAEGLVAGGAAPAD